MANLALGWIQLKKQPLRLAVALCGVSFAVILVLMQLGFRESMFTSAVRYHESFRYDIVLLSPKSPFIVQLRPFTERRLYQAMAVDGVESVAPVYVRIATWKRPRALDTRAIFVVAFDPSDDALDLPDVAANLDRIKDQSSLLFDRFSRPEFGDVAGGFSSEEGIEAELNNQRFRVTGLFELGTSFGIDGSVVMSDQSFLRLFPEHRRGLISLGLIRIGPDVDPEACAMAIRAQVPEDVLVLTKQQFIQRERDYWDATTPIGYILNFGLMVGLVVGAIVVYQILFADVCDHAAEYATLKAIGYSNGFLSRVVLQQALALAVLGFVPGLLISMWLYGAASTATRLPLQLTAIQALAVFGLTLLMCSLAGLLALRKVWTTDPAEVF